MEITGVRIRLADGGNERLCGYCTITIDREFVVRDLRIIAGEKGLFVAMPSRKTMFRCPHCGHKNPHQARYCNECGKGQPQGRSDAPKDQSRLHVDIAHPITPECRRKIQDRVLDAFEEEQQRAGKSEDGRQPARTEEHEEEADFEYA